jgi:hypothetical protein
MSLYRSKPIGLSILNILPVSLLLLISPLLVIKPFRPKNPVPARRDSLTILLKISRRRYKKISMFEECIYMGVRDAVNLFCLTFSMTI